MTAYYLGIDLGTTALKAAAFRADEPAAVAVASRRLPVRAEADGTREQEPAAIRAALGEALAELQARLGPAWARVAGIGLAAQGGSGALVDRTTGTPHTPMYLWNDMRAGREQAAIFAERSTAYWQALSCRDVPGAGLARLRWLRARRPELFTEATLYAGVGEYAYFQLTDVWRQDACNALQAGGYYVPEHRLDADALALAGVGVDFVAPLREGHVTHPLSAAAAAWLGLPAGIPVAGPYMDHEAGYLAAQGLSPAPLQCSLGSAWVGNFVVDRLDRCASPLHLPIPSPVGPGWLVIMPLLTGNVSWDWALRTFLDPDPGKAFFAVDTLWQESLFPPEGLLCVPWFTQANPLVPEALGAGSFFGMSAHAAPADLVRALALGMVCEFARVFAEVASSGLVDTLVLGGGAGKGRGFRQLLAALFAPLPVVTLADEDVAGARGTLYALDPALARATALPVASPKKALCVQARTRLEQYCTFFDRLYGHVTLGAPYHVRPEEA